MDKTHARGPPQLEPNQGVISEVIAQHDKLENQGTEMERLINVETVALNPIDMKNNSNINKSKILGIDLISVPIDYIIEAISDKELKTSKRTSLLRGHVRQLRSFIHHVTQ